MKTALRLREQDPLPKDVVELYWTVQRTCDRLGYRFGGDLIVMTVVLAGYGTQKPLANMIDTIKQRGLQRNARVVAEWRGEMVPARYLSYSTGDQTVTVSLDGDPSGENREIPAAKVRQPTTEELTSLGE